MEKKIIESNSWEETFNTGLSIGKEAKPGNIFLLEGDLGVGKTVFSKGIGKGLGIKEPISSPTFTIVQVYDSGKIPLYHFDAYRIADVEEMDEIGYEDYFFGDGVCLIEWPSMIEEILPDDCIKISIEKDLEKGLDYRKIVIDKWR